MNHKKISAVYLHPFGDTSHPFIGLHQPLNQVPELLRRDGSRRACTRRT